MHSWYLLTSNEGINDPFKTFLALNHLDDELSLNRLVVLENVWLKFLIATTHLSDYIISLLLKVNLADTHEVKRSLDVHNWNSDIVLFNQLFDHLINF